MIISITKKRLIDSLDTLAVLGNYSEFRRVYRHLADKATFDADINVSVFETNIRDVFSMAVCIGVRY